MKPSKTVTVYKLSPKKTAVKSAPKKAAKKAPAKKVAAKTPAKKSTPKKAASPKKKVSTPAILRKQTFIAAMSQPEMSATEAARQAGLASPGMAGSRMMKNDEVREAVLSSRKSLAERCGITAEAVMLEFKALGFSSIGDYTEVLSSESIGAAIARLPREKAACIQEVTVERYWDKQKEETVTRTKFKLHPKESALTKIGQHLGIKGFKSSVSIKTGVHTQTNPDGTIATQAVMHLQTNDLLALAQGLDINPEDDD